MPAPIKKITVTIPTNSPFYQKDAAHEIGTNVVYTFNGQYFTNASAGHLQTTAEGFSGETDKSTPWKTLTKLLAVYQSGSSSNELSSVYSKDSASFLIEVFTNAVDAARFKKIGSSITNMSVVVGLETTNGVLAMVATRYNDSPKVDLQPFSLIKQEGKYFISAHDSSLMEENITMILDVDNIARFVK